MKLLIFLSLVGLTSGLFFHRPHRPGPPHRPPPPRPPTHSFGGLSNVARGKPVSASSRHPNYGNTGKLTDGGKATNVAQCFHTADVEHSSNRWARVDLGRLWGVQEVYLLNRGDCCGNRLRNFEVDVARSLTNPGGVEQVTSQTCFSRAAAVPQGQGIRTRCTQPIIGRYVTVILHSSSEPLHFCEIEVYASPVTNPCISRPCRSPSICRVKTDKLNIWHECGCANGYRGPSCNIAITACDSNPCQNGGQCRPNGLGFTCTCVNGFSGSNCGTRPAPCASNPCSNGGRCNANGGSYTCSCVGGFSGTNCQNAPNPCASNPCANGGRCNVNGGSYTCSCSAGYSGFNCQTAPNPCSPNPCRNGGRCSRNGASFTCVCVGSYTGPTCSSLSDPCHPNPCKNGGVCSTVVSGGKLTAKCYCAEGYEGTLCQTVKDPCHPSPCKNNGVCSTTVVGGALTFKCYCTSGYGGQTCSSVNDPCSSSPCKNGGRCSANGQGGFSCVCINGYSGKDCTQTADPCSSKPCKNGGMCRNIVQNGALVASCVCAPGFTGATCSQENNPCSSRPCKNGGTCSPQLTRSAATFKCSCKKGFSGETCDQKVDLSGACSSSPCLNGASCKPTSYGSYKCTCPALYQGDNCQIKSDWVNAPCGNSAGCTGENTVCFKGKCLCTPGYYYSVSSQKCIKSCPKSNMVGSYMIYPEARIKKNKDAKELNLNPDECKAVCNKDKNCLSISMLENEIKPKCFLHTVTVQDVPNDWAPMKEDWDYYQRHCK